MTCFFLIINDNFTQEENNSKNLLMMKISLTLFLLFCYSFDFFAQIRLVREFKIRGWSWGGDWRSVKDYQHFEKKIGKK